MRAAEAAMDAAERDAMPRAPLAALAVQFLSAVDELVIWVTVVFPAHHYRPVSHSLNSSHVTSLTLYNFIMTTQSCVTIV